MLIFPGPAEPSEQSERRYGNYEDSTEFNPVESTSADATMAFVDTKLEQTYGGYVRDANGESFAAVGDDPTKSHPGTSDGVPAISMQRTEAGMIRTAGRITSKADGSMLGDAVDIGAREISGITGKTTLYEYYLAQGNVDIYDYDGARCDASSTLTSHGTFVSSDIGEASTPTDCTWTDGVNTVDSVRTMQDDTHVVGTYSGVISEVTGSADMTGKNRQQMQDAAHSGEPHVLLQHEASSVADVEEPKVEFTSKSKVDVHTVVYTAANEDDFLISRTGALEAISDSGATHRVRVDQCVNRVQETTKTTSALGDSEPGAGTDPGGVPGEPSDGLDTSAMQFLQGVQRTVVQDTQVMESSWGGICSVEVTDLTVESATFTVHKNLVSGTGSSAVTTPKAVMDPASHDGAGSDELVGQLMDPATQGDSGLLVGDNVQVDVPHTTEHSRTKTSTGFFYDKVTNTMLDGPRGNALKNDDGSDQSTDTVQMSRHSMAAGIGASSTVGEDLVTHMFGTGQGTQEWAKQHVNGQTGVKNVVRAVGYRAVGAASTAFSASVAGTLVQKQLAYITPDILQANLRGTGFTAVAGVGMRYAVDRVTGNRNARPVDWLGEVWLPLGSTFATFGIFHMTNAETATKVRTSLWGPDEQSLKKVSMKATLSPLMFSKAGRFARLASAGGKLANYVPASFVAAFTKVAPIFNIGLVADFNAITEGTRTHTASSWLHGKVHFKDRTYVQVGPRLWGLEATVGLVRGEARTAVETTGDGTTRERLQHGTEFGLNFGVADKVGRFRTRMCDTLEERNAAHVRTQYNQYKFPGNQDEAGDITATSTVSTNEEKTNVRTNYAWGVWKGRATTHETELTETTDKVRAKYEGTAAEAMSNSRTARSVVDEVAHIFQQRHVSGATDITDISGVRLLASVAPDQYHFSRSIECKIDTVLGSTATIGDQRLGDASGGVELFPDTEHQTTRTSVVLSRDDSALETPSKGAAYEAGTGTRETYIVGTAKLGTSRTWALSDSWLGDGAAATEHESIQVEGTFSSMIGEAKVLGLKKSTGSSAGLSSQPDDSRGGNARFFHAMEVGRAANRELSRAIDNRQTGTSSSVYALGEKNFDLTPCEQRKVVRIVHEPKTAGKPVKSSKSESQLTGEAFRCSTLLPGSKAFSSSDLFRVEDVVEYPTHWRSKPIVRNGVDIERTDLPEVAHRYTAALREEQSTRVYRPVDSAEVLGQTPEEVWEGSIVHLHQWTVKDVFEARPILEGHGKDATLGEVMQTDRETDVKLQGSTYDRFLRLGASSDVSIPLGTTFAGVAGQVRLKVDSISTRTVATRDELRSVGTAEHVVSHHGTAFVKTETTKHSKGSSTVSKRLVSHLKLDDVVSPGKRKHNVQTVTTKSVKGTFVEQTSSWQVTSSADVHHDSWLQLSDKTPRTVDPSVFATSLDDMIAKLQSKHEEAIRSYTYTPTLEGVNLEAQLKLTRTVKERIPEDHHQFLWQAKLKTTPTPRDESVTRTEWIYAQRIREEKGVLDEWTQQTRSAKPKRSTEYRLSYDVNHVVESVRDVNRVIWREMGFLKDEIASIKAIELTPKTHEFTQGPGDDDGGTWDTQSVEETTVTRAANIPLRTGWLYDEYNVREVISHDDDSALDKIGSGQYEGSYYRMLQNVPTLIRDRTRPPEHSTDEGPYYRMLSSGADRGIGAATGRLTGTTLALLHGGRVPEAADAAVMALEDGVLAYAAGMSNGHRSIWVAGPLAFGTAVTKHRNVISTLDGDAVDGVLVLLDVGVQFVRAMPRLDLPPEPLAMSTDVRGTLWLGIDEQLYPMCTDSAN